MSNTTSTDDYQDSGDGTSISSFGYGLGLSAAVLFVFFIITYLSYRCKNSPSATLRHRSSADYGEGTIRVVIQHDHGLDAAAISTFPQYTYAQLKPHKSAASGCAVCLGEYKDTETLRLLPECGHIFHRSCIDPWLMTHPTCPICRSSPLPRPAPPVAIADQ